MVRRVFNEVADAQGILSKARNEQSKDASIYLAQKSKGETGSGFSITVERLGKDGDFEPRMLYVLKKNSQEGSFVWTRVRSIPELLQLKSENPRQIKESLTDEEVESFSRWFADTEQGRQYTEIVPVGESQTNGQTYSEALKAELSSNKEKATIVLPPEVQKNEVQKPMPDAQVGILRVFGQTANGEDILKNLQRDHTEKIPLYLIKKSTGVGQNVAISVRQLDNEGKLHNPKRYVLKNGSSQWTEVPRDNVLSKLKSEGQLKTPDENDIISFHQWFKVNEGAGYAEVVPAFHQISGVNVQIDAAGQLHSAVVESLKTSTPQVYSSPEVVQAAPEKKENPKVDVLKIDKAKAKEALTKTQGTGAWLMREDEKGRIAIDTVIASSQDKITPQKEITSKQITFAQITDPSGKKVGKWLLSDPAHPQVLAGELQKFSAEQKRSASKSEGKTSLKIISVSQENFSEIMKINGARESLDALVGKRDQAKKYTTDKTVPSQGTTKPFPPPSGISTMQTTVAKAASKAVDPKSDTPEREPPKFGS